MQAIDQAILSEAAPEWRKVARIVGSLLKALPGISENVPLQLYVQRVERLVGRGRLESAGDLRLIRYCEVRIPVHPAA